MLRIIAGTDKEFNGEVVFSQGYSVGYLEQEPKLDETKTVQQIVEEAVQSTVDLLKEFEEINAKFAEPMDDDAMNELIERQGEVQEKLDHADAWDLDSRLEMAMDALRCPPPETSIKNSQRWRKTTRRALPSCCCKSPTFCCSMSRQTISTPRRSAWLEQHLQKYEGTIIAVTHDRYFLDNVAGWILELDRGEGIPYQGNYSSWLEQKRTRLAQEARSEDKLQKTLERELEWIRMSPKGRHAKWKGPHQRLRSDGRDRVRKASR